jgi:hypothetical protein
MDVYEEVREARAHEQEHAGALPQRAPLHERVARQDERLSYQQKLIDELERELARMRGILVRAAEELGIDGERA